MRVGKHVQLAKLVKIWKHCNIYGTSDSPVRIGSCTQIGGSCEIQPGVTIGKYCRVHAFTFICEGTVINNYAFVGPRVTFLNDKYPRALTAGKRQLWKCAPPTVDHHASIGGGAVIGPGVRIGAYALVGMGAVVTKDVKPYEIVVGNPACVVGLVTNSKYPSVLGKK